ncbi:RidA family protein [Pseudomonas sp. MPC6]|uniref:RidA family protein n=1 Tax=unclassified Pseudomonas TaxID=196821 RepID=UPI00111039CA|nr:RidA family protein [Pseudomonas sp. MPC6]QCY09433.1 RidA family protein [Pseudomonas sp. MPC6]
MSTFIPVIPKGMETYYNDYQFSPAVRSGDLLIISGQLGFNPDGSLPEDPANQINNAFQAIGYILQSEALDFSNIIAIDSFHIGDMHKQFELMIGEKAKFIAEPHPAWTAVGVASLAMPEAVVEIKVTARVVDQAKVSFI